MKTLKKVTASIKKQAAQIMRLISRRWAFLGIVVLVGIVVIPHFAFAQDSSVPFSSPEIDKVYQQIIQFLQIIMEFLQRLIWPVLLMIGGLLKPDILYGAGMEQAMLAVWTNIRNIVNILFVLVLLGIAFYNVMGGKQQDYHLKAILPKFVIALIAVNFSFLVVKVVVDAVNVVTTAIFALPNAVQRDLQRTPTLEQTICEGIYGPYSNTDKYGANIAAASNDGKKPFCEATAPALTQDAQRFFSSYDSNNAAIVLAVNMQQIGKLPTVKEGTTTLKDLGINVLFSIVLFIVFTTAFIALLVILLVRLVVLWLAAVLSPLFFLSAVLPASMKSSLGGDDLSKQFMQTAIAPIPIAVVMAIGFIMMTTLKQAQFGDANALGTSTLGVSMLTSGLSTLQDVVAAVGTVAFIWVGVFKAANGTAAQKIVDGIKGTVEGAGKFIATAPIKYAPIFPAYTVDEKTGELKEAAPITLATAGGVLHGMGRGMEQKSQQRADEILKGFGAGNAFKHRNDMQNAKSDKDMMQTLTNANADRQLGDEGLQKSLSPQLKKYGNRIKWDFDFGEHKDRAGFEKALAEGKVKESVMQNFYDKNKDLFPGMQPIKEPAGADKPKNGADKPAAPPPPGAELKKAEGAITDSSYNSRKYMLSADEQKKLEEIRGAKDPAAAEALAKDPGAQAALKKLDDVGAEQGAFASGLAGAVAKKDTAQINQLIRKRREELKAKIKATSGVTDEAELEKRANAVMSKELKAIPDDLKKKSDAQGVIDGVQTATPDAGNAPPPIQRSAPAPAKPAAAKPGAPAKPAAPPPALKKISLAEAQKKLPTDKSLKVGDKVYLAVPGGGTEEYIIE